VRGISYIFVARRALAPIRHHEVKPMSSRFLLGLVVATATMSALSARAEGPEELLKQLPSGGIRFATELNGSTPDDKGRFVIGQVDSTGLKLLADEAHSDYGAVLWLDHSRLVAISGFTDSDVSLQVYVDGLRSGGRVPVPAEVWQLKPGEELGMLAELGRDDKGQVWLGNCVQFNESDPERCSSWVGVPFDVATKTFGETVRKRPKGLIHARFNGPGVDPASVKGVKAPKGWKIRFHKTNILDGSAMMGSGRGLPAFTCKGPDGTATWPTSDVVNWEFSPRPKRVTWIMQDPPIYVVSGTATSPIGTSSKGSMAFSGCSPQAMDGFALTGTPVWFEGRQELTDFVVTGSHWIVRVGPHELGQVRGSNYLFSLAPN